MLTWDPRCGYPPRAIASSSPRVLVPVSIEHAISDFPTWKQAFDRFAEARRNAGVVRHRIRRPVDDPHYLVIELEFRAHENADNFRQFLDNVVWANRDASPALAGEPETRILAACSRQRTLNGSRKHDDLPNHQHPNETVDQYEQVPSHLRDSDESYGFAGPHRDGHRRERPRRRRRSAEGARVGPDG